MLRFLTYFGYAAIMTSAEIRNGIKILENQPTTGSARPMVEIDDLKDGLPLAQGNCERK